MNMKDKMGAGEKAAPRQEFKGVVQSPVVNGEATVVLEEEGVTLLSMFGQLMIPFREMDAFGIENHSVFLDSGKSRAVISKLGAETEPLFRAVWKEYNKLVLEALFVEGAPKFETMGEYSYRDEGGQSAGVAVVQVYPDCVCILPPNAEGRRIPLCFAVDIEEGNYRLKIALDTGEEYEIMKLGADNGPFLRELKGGMLAMREKAIDAVRAIDGSLTQMEAAAVAGLMPEGMAAPLGGLAEISASFVDGIGARIGASRAAEEFQYFMGVCDPRQICVGLKSGLAGEAAEDLIWMAAPARSGKGVAAVEFAVSEETSAATFLYSFSGDWEDFRKRLNHAIEAVNFRREVIRMSDEALSKPENARYAMAVKRTGALRLLRSCLAGRAIHQTEASWKREMDKWML